MAHELKHAEEHGALYWFCVHSWGTLERFAARHRTALRATVLTAFALSFIFRAQFQWLFLEMRKHFIVFILVALICVAAAHLWRKPGRKAKLAFFLLNVLLICGAVVGQPVYEYFSLYYRFQRLQVSELKELPLTDYERIQPQSSVFALAHDAVTESESPRTPDFVRVNDEYRWTMAIEPAYPMARVFRGVHELFSLPGGAAAPSFSAENRVKVNFPVGEHLKFSRSSSTATIRSFGLFRYFTYEPSEVLYFPDDNGEWVQVVSLIRWRGLFFPWPEFGGVQVIRQEPDSLVKYLKLFFAGAGDWIPPERVPQHRFLRGQNVVSQQVTRRMADSLRFQNGFLSPLPGYHDGDARIPTLEQDVNPQPFVSYFRVEGEVDGRLFHYFALEPFDSEKQGLNTSLFVPADGSPGAYIFRHYQHATSLSGVSSVATKVMESRKEYDWDRNRPVEHRPFIKEIDGKKHFFWLTTVVTARIGTEPGRYIAGSIPDVVLTDAQFNTTFWLNATAPDTWLENIQKVMKSHWNQE